MDSIFTDDKLKEIRESALNAKPFYEDKHEGSDEDENRVVANGLVFNYAVKYLPDLIDELLKYRQHQDIKKNCCEIEKGCCENE